MGDAQYNLGKFEEVTKICFMGSKDITFENTIPQNINTVGFIVGRVYSAGKNFTGKINPDVILPVKLKFYRQNKSRSYSGGKT